MEEPLQKVMAFAKELVSRSCCQCPTVTTTVTTTTPRTILAQGFTSATQSHQPPPQQGQARAWHSPVLPQAHPHSHILTQPQPVPPVPRAASGSSAANVLAGVAGQPWLPSPALTDPQGPNGRGLL